MRLRECVLGFVGLAAVALAPSASLAMSFTIESSIAPNAGVAQAASFGSMSQSGEIMTWRLNPDFDEALFQSTASSGDPTVTGTPLYMFDRSTDSLLDLDPSDPETSLAVLRVNTWTSMLKVDPFVTNSFSITNTTGGIAFVSMNVSLLIPDGFTYNQVIDSSISATLTDSNGSTSALATADGGTPIYSGRVNSTTELLTLNPGFPLSCSGTPGCTDSGVDAQSPDPLAVTQGVANEIALWIRFELSAGDTVGVTSRFEIIPEPGTALLLGLGLIGLGMSGRRRG